MAKTSNETWIPTKKQWAGIHKDLPTSADLRTFDQHVLLSAWLYFGIDSRSESHIEHWQQVTRILRETNWQLNQVVRQLRPVIEGELDIVEPADGAPVSESAPAPNKVDMPKVDMLTVLLSLLTIQHTIIWEIDGQTIHPVRSLWKERRELLYANLLAACTGPGRLPLSDSEEGPLTRTMIEILRCVLPKAPTRGMREIIKREKDRRARGVGVGGFKL